MELISFRVIILGLFLCILIGLGEPFSVLYLQSSPLAADFSTGAAIFLFFILVGGINKLNKLIFKKFYLKPVDLITIYIMMIVACAIPSWGFVMNLIGLIGGIHYYATGTNEWAEIIHPHLPRYLFPEKYETILYLFEGIPKKMKIPWYDWIKPLSNWFFFIIVFYILSICLMIFLRKQWVEKEKISYPLTELPQALVNEKINLFKSGIFWLGFLIPFFVYGLKGLHILNPLFPQIVLSKKIAFLTELSALPLVYGLK